MANIRKTVSVSKVQPTRMGRSFDNGRSKASTMVAAKLQVRSRLCCESTRSFAASALDDTLREQSFTGARSFGVSILEAPL